MGVVGLIAFLLGGTSLNFLTPSLKGMTSSHKGHDEPKEGKEHNDRDGHTEGKGKDDHKEERVIKLTKEEIKEFGIGISTAGPGKLQSYLTLTGEVVLNPDRVVHITPRVSGIVQKVFKNIGSAVKEKEVLALLESPELAQMKIEYLDQKKKMELLIIDLKRLKTIYKNTRELLALLKKSPSLEELRAKTAEKDLGPYREKLISSYASLVLSREMYELEMGLLKKKISSRADFLRVQNEYKKAQSTYFTAYDNVTFEIEKEIFSLNKEEQLSRSSLLTLEQKLHILGLSEKDMENLKKDQPSHRQNLGRVELKSFMNGIVIEKHLALGEFIQKENTPFLVANLDTVWVYLSIYQKDFFSIRKGQKIWLSAEESPGVFQGEIDFVSPVVSEKTRTAQARVIIKEPKGLWKPGMFVKGRVLVKEEKVPLLIPKTALQTINGEPCVFVQTAKGFELREVKTGRENHTHVEISSGLKKGERCVFAGASTLKFQLAKGEFESGHNH